MRLHVVQYQKANPNDPSSHYRLDVTIKDAKGMVIGTVGMVDAPSGQGVSVASRLLVNLIVIAQNIDSDALLFRYGDQWFGSNDQPHHCKS